MQPLLKYPPENVRRGILAAVLVVPIGVLVWVLFWSMGVIVAVAGVGIAAGTVGLYRWGSGGRIGLPGAAIASGLIVLTIALGFVVGIVSDQPDYFRAAILAGVPLPAAFISALGFYTAFIRVILLVTVVIAAAGVIFAFSTALAQRRALRNEHVVLEPRG